MYLTCITITQSTIITSPIGFNIGLTNVDARLKQCCINVVPTLFLICVTLFQRRPLTLYQRCATLKIRRRILFHFQRRIKVISTLIHNVETTLIRRWMLAGLSSILAKQWKLTRRFELVTRNSCFTFPLENSFLFYGRHNLQF